MKPWGFGSDFPKNLRVCSRNPRVSPLLPCFRHDPTNQYTLECSTSRHFVIHPIVKLLQLMRVIFFQAALGAHERMTSNRRVARLCRRVRERWMKLDDVLKEQKLYRKATKSTRKNLKGTTNIGECGITWVLCGWS